ncbi:hypothetical protein PgNI_05172 [Pyricularia grisea]|uniref:Uncharacterized protein n=1 Tax=Pyricularia grisea TaxID=148305 RepID=A0A6P8B6A6_PYRGI|nr:hypothetical protein PgNI_05172 [Pyricularia grisea]TLD10847.1 hypothetical protein PgNI_05172 [Pyricularia grisea]
MVPAKRRRLLLIRFPKDELACSGVDAVGTDNNVGFDDRAVAESHGAGVLIHTFYLAPGMDYSAVPSCFPFKLAMQVGSVDKLCLHTPQARSRIGGMRNGLQKKRKSTAYMDVLACFNEGTSGHKASNARTDNNDFQRFHSYVDLFRFSFLENENLIK